MACKAAHGTQPGVFWCKVMEKETGKYPQVTRLFVPVLCNHCKEPLCKTVCPTGATFTDGDGMVLIDYEKCIGCRACMLACPYQARTYVEKETYYFPGTPIPYAVDELRGFEGVVQKCTFCADRVKAGGQPACVEVCPTSCRVFGDLNDPESEPCKLIRSRHGFQLLADKGSDPSVFYTR
jgi:molybdopterin-containing oxidoreductase family iron-sulfur binding subunit